MSGIQTAGSQSLRLCSNDGARILHTKQHRKPTQAAAATGTAGKKTASLFTSRLAKQVFQLQIHCCVKLSMNKLSV